MNKRRVGVVCVNKRRVGGQHACCRSWVRSGTKLLRSAAVIGLARKAYTEAQKPQNQARIKEAVAKVQARRNGGAGRRAPVVPDRRDPWDVTARGDAQSPLSWSASCSAAALSRASVSSMPRRLRSGNPANRMTAAPTRLYGE